MMICDFPKLYAVTLGLNRRFPEGNAPFKMMTRLLEESGEPDRDHLAKEVLDVLRCAVQVAIYYGIEHELESPLQASYERLKQEEH